MNRRSAPARLLIACATVLIVCTVAPPAFAGACSYSRAAADWIFTDNGTVVGIGPRAAFGKFKLNAAGDLLNGAATSSLNGTVADETFYGTYTVNPDCTGTISIQIFSAATELFAVTVKMVFDEKMEHLNGIFTSVVPPGSATSLPTVVAVEARRQ